MDVTAKDGTLVIKDVYSAFLDQGFADIGSSLERPNFQFAPTLIKLLEIVPVV